MKINDKEYTYNKLKSNEIWVMYENDETIIIGIHGADNFKLTTLSSKIIFNPNEKQRPQINRFKKFHLELLNSPKNVIIVAHSLGCWLLGTAENDNKNNKINGIMFAPFIPNFTNSTSNFIASSIKFKKIFYLTDWFASNLLNMSMLNNAIILKPKLLNNIRYKFPIGHSLSIFTSYNVRLVSNDITRVK